MLDRRFISKSELNDFVGFSMGKINKMMKNKELKYSKIGKSVRFDMDDIIEMFKKGVV
jgi:predicted DNA-binding transcriptional regulator AlpA